MKKRNAYIDQFKKADMFKVKFLLFKDFEVPFNLNFKPKNQDNLDEFDDARHVVGKLIEEYRMATKPDYLMWQQNQNVQK